MNINKKLLPIKGHYFLFNAGTSPLVPYLSTYARQLGFSSGTVGLIYTVLPIFGLVAKPLFGVIADRYRIQKSLFILFQIVTIISFSLIYVIPENRESMSVELDCNGGITVLKSCYAPKHQADKCKIDSLEKHTLPTTCRMNCEMSTPRMWQTVCEHWHLPYYCYSNTDIIEYKAMINNVSLKDDCAYIAAYNVTLDDKYTYTPKCRIGDGYVDINEPCTLNCADKKISAAIGSERANMTCVDKMLNYRLCSNDTVQLAELAKGTTTGECSASCDLDKHTPWRLMEICEGWEADVASTCHPKTAAGGHFPSNLSFEGIIKPTTTLLEHGCVYIQLHEIKLPDDTTRIPYCSGKALYENTSVIFNTSCQITCGDNILVNEIFQGAQDSRATEMSQFTTQFWLFFLMMIISWVGQAVVVTFADAICFNLLGDKMSQYGKQRLWGSVGWGIFSLITGVLIDHFSEGAYKNYTIAFVFMFVFMMGDVFVSCFIKTESTKMSLNILSDVGTLLSSIHTVVFMIWTIAVGFSTGFVWQFLFWHLEDVSGLSCDGAEYTKTLQGLVSAIQTFLGEIPFMFVSGYILRKLGHVNMMSLVLFAFGVRFILYSFLTNAWWVLPIEILQGVTYGMLYPTMTSYANVVSPPGTETTVQGLVGAVFEGLGVSLGSLIGGRLYQSYGGWKTFEWFGIASFIFCILHIIAQHVIKDKNGLTGAAQGKENATE